MLKRQFIIVLFIVLNKNLFAQEFKNNLKVNLVGAAAGLYSLQFEHVFGKHLSFNNTLFYRNSQNIPFGKQIDSLAKQHGLGLTGVDFKYFLINEAKIGVKGYSPELRYYFGNKKNRVFIGGFGQYENYDMVVPAILLAKYQEQIFEITAPINFTVQAMSAGILIGKQFNFGKRLVLDFVVIGPHIGKANNVHAYVSDDLLSRFSDEERTFLKEKVIERFGLSQTYYDVNVSSQQAEIKTKKQVPFLGIRGLGLNLGYRF